MKCDVQILKKVFKCLKIDFENPADARLFYGTIWNIIIFYKKI